MERIIENNNASIIGAVASDFVFSHEAYGEKFYSVMFSVDRLSGMKDTIPVMISERLLDVNHDYKGCIMEVSGQFRSYNQFDEGKKRLNLYVFAREVTHLDEMQYGVKTNCVFLDGFICKKPIYRETPLGREIADIMLAINRPYGKSDYIPCIAWGRNARFASELEVGTNLQVRGRIQSREYIKKLSEEQYEIRVAYEVSLFSIKAVFQDIENVGNEEYV